MNTDTDRLEFLIDNYYTVTKWDGQYSVDGDYINEYPGWFPSYAEAIDAAMELAKEYEAAEWYGYSCVAYDCPDKTLINEVFEVRARDIKEARRMAWDSVPHAVSIEVSEIEEEEAL